MGRTDATANLSTETPTFVPTEWALKQLKAYWPAIEILEVLPAENPSKVHVKAFLPDVGQIGLRVLTADPKDPQGPQRLAAAFHRAQTIAAIPNDGAINTLQAGSLSGCLVVVSEWQEGVPLLEYFKSEERPYETSLAMIDMIAQALETYHEAGWVHSYLRSDSILVTGPGQAMISGHGIIDVLTGYDPDPLDPKRTYAAPEITGDPNAARAIQADVYGLGVIAYEILTGELPTGHFLKMPSQVTGAGKWLDDVILRTIHPNPELRVATIKQFRDEMASQTLKLMDLTKAPVEEKQRGPAEKSGVTAMMRGHFIVFMIFGIVVIGGSLWFSIDYYKKNEGKPPMDPMELVTTMAQVAAAISSDDSASAADFDALLSKIEDAGPQALQLVLEEQLALMKSEGKHEEALELAKKVAELNIGKEGVAYDEMNAQLEHLQEEMDEYTASMDAANTAFAEGDDSASAADFDALLSKIEDAGPQALQLVLEEQLALMKSEGKHEEALELAKKVAELNIGKEGVAYDEMHIGKEGVAYDEMNAQLEHLQEEMDEYTASMDAANTAFAEGDETAEEEALFKALETFPNDRKATRKLSQTSKRFAIAWDEVEPELKRWNADQKEWHVTLYRDALGLELDISGHDNLAFINPLKNLPIDRLDIRHTKVRDLSPATGMYLSGIWCDHSEVTDLEPLRNEPLQVLSIMDTAVNDFEIVPSLTFLNVLCVDPKHEIPMCIPYPSKHQMWENAIGVRFIPAVGTGHLMSSREITQHHYANFAIAASSEIMTEEDRTEFKKEATLHPMMLDLTEALSFCEWLTKRDQKAGHLLLGGIYRLPDPRELAALQKHVSTAGAEEGAQSVISQKVGPVAEGPCQRGFFDVLGNAEEWEISYGDLQIFNSRRTYPKGLDAKTKRAIRLVLDLSDARLSTPIPQVVTKTIEEEGS